MKVVVAHNRYRSDVPSGENLVVDAEIELLRDAGVEVVPVIADSDRVTLRSPRGLADAALGPVYAPQGVPRMKAVLERERPDVVHLHNVYPLLSPWVVRTAHDHGVPVVQTVHNFRHDCVAGTYFRDGRPCTDCAGRTVATPALEHGCYRGSRLQSVPMVVGRTLHRSTWRSVDRFLALTDFHADYLVALGVPEQNVVVRPTSAPDPGEPTEPSSDDVLLVARLEEQKGVRLLLDAWAARTRRGPGALHVVGDGPLRGLVDAAAAADPSIVVHGLLPSAATAARIRSAGAVVVPSTWYEGLPRVVVEAFAHGRAVVATDLGGLGSVVDETVGWRTAADPRALTDVLDTIDLPALRAKGAAARQTYLTRYAPAVTTGQLLDVYTDLSGSRT